jgi:hypothetical protein
MDRVRTVTPRRGPSGLLAAVAVSLVVLVAACGGSGGGGGPDYDKVVASIQATFGTSMLDSTIEGDVITVTIDNNFSAGGAALFMCSNILTILENNGASAVTVVIVNERGEELSRSTDCR